MREENRNTVWAGAFVDELVRAGVRIVCVAPGSRSTPLVLASAEHPRIGIVTQIDERSAGYFALGVGKSTGRPAAVVTTSGTAAANLYPAVIEAAQSDTPLLALTADRPPGLRHTDANQTIDQVDLFGSYPRAFFDIQPPEMSESALGGLRTLAGHAVATAVGVPPGPVHLNFPFAKPLEPTKVDGDVPTGLMDGPGAAGRADGRPFATTLSVDPSPPPQALDALAARVAQAPRGIIVAGPVPNPREAGPALRRLAARTGYPLLADPLSGARFGDGATDHVVAHYDAFLRDQDVAASLGPSLVLRFGATPTSTALAGFLERSIDATLIVIDAGWRNKDQTGSADEYYHADPSRTALLLAECVGGASEPVWTARWRTADRAAASALVRATLSEGSEPRVVQELVATLHEDATLVVGNSMPVRDLDRYAAARDQALTVYGNRGASGIDGIVSTTMGVAAGIGAPTVAVLGDLSFFYDSAGLFAARDVAAPVVFVVINNDGGGIFESLPVRDYEPVFTRHLVVPHGFDFSHVAALHGLAFEHVGAAEVGNAVCAALDAGTSAVLEVRSDSRQEWAWRGDNLRAACAAARDSGETR